MVEYKCGNILWLAVLGCFAAFLMAVGIGGNETANVFATSVGSKTLAMWHAVVLSTIFTTAGVFVNYDTFDTMLEADIANWAAYLDSPQQLAAGSLCAMIATAVWLLIMTYLETPVSSEHTLIGAVVGFTLVAQGQEAVFWYIWIFERFVPLRGVASVALSWFFSPLSAAIIVTALFLFVRFFLLGRPGSVGRVYVALPFIAAITIFVNVYAVLDIWRWPERLPPRRVVLLAGVAALIAFVLALVISVAFACSPDPSSLSLGSFASGELPGSAEHTGAIQDVAAEKLGDKAAGVPHPEPVSRGRRPADDELGPGHVPMEITLNVTPHAHDVQGASHEIGNGESTTLALNAPGNETLDSGGPAVPKPPAAGGATSCFNPFSALRHPYVRAVHANTESLDARAEAWFKPFLVLTACCDAVLHGRHNVTNAAAALSAMVWVWREGEVDRAAQLWWGALAISAAGSAVGFALLGVVTVRSLGVTLMKVSPARGLCIELAGLATMGVLRYFGIPYAYVYSQMGARVSVALFEGIEGVNWRVVTRAIVGCVVSPFAAAGLSAALMLAARRVPPCSIVPALSPVGAEAEAPAPFLKL